jgi:serpin B
MGKIQIRYKRIVLFILVLSLMNLLDSCGGGNSTNPEQTQKQAKSTLARNLSPAVDQGDIAELVNGNSAFAIELYQNLKGGQGGNIFFSPYSISLALAMTYAGTEGETASEIAQAMHFTLPEERLHPAFDALDLSMADLGYGAKNATTQFKLNIANSLWAQDGFSILANFLDILAVSYGAGVNLLDFINSPEDSRTVINKWVDDETNGKIKDLLTQGSIDTYTRLVMVNAIYFKAAWASTFDPKVTQVKMFTRADNAQVNVPMMSQIESIPYCQGNDYQAVELPYDGGNASMVIIVADPGKFDSLENAFSLSQWIAITHDLHPSEVAITMPRFNYEGDTISLKQILTDMGMPTAFTETADFSGITDPTTLFIQDVLHKAFLKVDETGTEAAAATGVIVGTTSAPTVQVSLTIDRPFLFFIRDRISNSILFMGRIVDPS